MGFDNPCVCAGETVLGETGDGLKESRAYVVVEKAARQSLLLSSHEARLHLVGEFANRRSRVHQDSTSRKVAYR